MGNANSKKKKKKDLTHEQLLARYGVLTPPSFGTGSDPILPPSSFSTNDTAGLLGGGASGSEAVKSVLRASSSSRLLSSEHVAPGLWVNASTSDGDGTAFVGYDASTKGSILNLSKFFLSSGSGTRGGMMRLLAATERDSDSSSIRATGFVDFGNGIEFHGSTAVFAGGGSARGVETGLVSCLYNKTLSRPASLFVEDKNGVGYYRTPAERPPPLKFGLNMGASLSFTDRSANTPVIMGDVGVRSAHGHCSVTVPRWGCAAAMGLDVPLADPNGVTGVGTTSSLGDVWPIIRKRVTAGPKLSYLATFDLNAATDDGAEKENAGPPIFVTLHRINDPTAPFESSSIETAATVGQTVTFDRWVANILEDRCPKIRNTLTWAVRMDHRTSSVAKNDAATTDGLHAARSEVGLSAALAWQANRGLCYKAQAEPNGGLTFGIILKRWKQPRVTASLMFGTTPSNNDRYGSGGTNLGFKGVGIQIETGPVMSHAAGQQSGAADALSGSDKDNDLLYGSSTGRVEPDDVPKTKAELPSHY